MTPTPPPRPADGAEVARTAGARLPEGNRDALRATGADAADFLHRMLTCPVKGMAAGARAAGVALKGDGRIIAPVEVHRLSDTEFLILTPGGLGAKLATHLDRFLITETATVGPYPAGRPTRSFVGPGARAAVAAMLSLRPTAVAEDAPTAHADTGGNSIVVVPDGRFGLTGFTAVVEEGVFPRREARDDDAALAELPAAALTLLQIESGEPRYGHEYDESTIALEVGFGPRIDFDKGCFPGQEVVARIENLGHPAKTMVGLRFDGSRETSAAGLAGRTLTGDDGKPAGKVTGVAWSDAAGAVTGLAMVKWAYREPGTKLDAEVGPATVVVLPMVG